MPLDRRAVEAAVAAAVSRHPVVAAAWLFGSVARGDAGAESDLDVAVLPRHRPDVAEMARLYSIAGELERWSPSGKVDLVVLGDQGSVLRHRVLREGIRVYDADPDTRVDFEGRTISEYLDWKPTHEIAMRSTLSGLRDRLARVPR